MCAQLCAAQSMAQGFPCKVADLGIQNFGLFCSGLCPVAFPFTIALLVHRKRSRNMPCSSAGLLQGSCILPLKMASCDFEPEFLVVVSWHLFPWKLGAFCCVLQYRSVFFSWPRVLQFLAQAQTLQIQPQSSPRMQGIGSFLRSIWSLQRACKP